jgi:pyruvate/2-oxoglutarate dehydrogenase complex dihydrolipoamide acyltransferase (E2) component
MQAVHIPHEHVNDESVMLVKWLAADGSQVKAGQSLVVIETSKATTEVEAPRAGYLRHGAAEGTEVPVGGIFCHITDGPAEEVKAAAPVVPVATPGAHVAAVPPVEAARTSAPPSAHKDTNGEGAPAGAPAEIRYSRKALELIEQHGLSRELFKGRNLVREGDVLALLGGATPSAERNAAPVPEKSAPAAAPVPGPTAATGVPIRTEDLPRRKRVEARYLASGVHNTLTSVVSVLCSAEGLNGALKMQPDLGRSAAPVIIYETARLLRKYPVLNAFHDRGQINYYERVNVGLAVDAGSGLKVPVVENADTKGVVEIAAEVENLLLAYVTDEIPVAALAGGTFTITDLSSEDVFTFHPLINQGQAAILGVGAPFTTSGTGDAVFHLILSFDHQLTEGRTAALFLKELRDRIESYAGVRGDGEPGHGGQPACTHCGRPASDPAVGVLIEAINAEGRKGYICKSCLLES